MMDLSEALYNTFRSSEGRTALAWILNECGYFATSKEDVDPSLIAFAGRLIKATGLAVHGDAGKYVNALLESYDGTMSDK